MLNNSEVAKPINSFKKIIEALEPHATLYTAWKRTRYLPQLDRMVRILLEGEIEVYREGDFLHMITVEAPAIFGLIESDFTFGAVHTRPSQDAKIVAIPYERASEIFYQARLWRYVTDIIAYRTEFLIKYQQIFIRKTSREIICLLIMNLIPDSIDTSLSTYILKKTVISRSMVMSELSLLRCKGIIQMKSGKLINVDKEKLLDHSGINKK